MNTALIVVDRRFFKIEGKWYTAGPSGPETGEKYLPYFDRVIVAGRQGCAAGLQTEKLTRVHDDINIVCLENMSGILAQIFNRKRVYDEIFKLAESVSAVVVRVPTELGYIAAEVGVRKNLLLAADIGDCAYDSMKAHGGILAKAYAPIRFIRARQTVNRADFVHYVTHSYLQNRYPAKSGARCLSAPNVSIPPLDRAVLDERLQRIQHGKTPLVFGTVGSLSGRLKGIHIAIEALGRMKDEMPPFEFRVLGGGDPSELEALAQKFGVGDKVYFEGTLPAGDAVLSWLSDIDIYLQPSLREGVSRATIEAMSRACPAIVSDVAGMYELIPRRERVIPGNVASLRTAITHSLSSDWQRERAIENWHRAGNYTLGELGPKRESFWKEFSEAARLKYLNREFDSNSIVL